MGNALQGLFRSDTPPAWCASPWFFVLLAVALYANTTRNQFALDDGLVLRENSFVMKGVDGIPDILAHDSFYGAIGNSAYLSGGRYRPLSLVTYAIEVSVFGVQPAVHHAVNVLLYALNAVVLLRFLRRFVVPRALWVAWIVTFLFTIHPVHTEVVANIKGRDELLSFLFLVLTMHHALAHVTWRAAAGAQQDTVRTKRKERKAREAIGTTKGKWSGMLSVLFFALALLSKENGLAFVVLLPLTVYFFTDLGVGRAVRTSLPVIGLVVLYMVLRVVLLEARNNTVQEIMDNPYLLATTTEKAATILYVEMRYIALMFWPHPLTYDYSFHEIPYKTFGDPLVLLSAALHIGALVYAVRATKRKDILAWCIFFYAGTMGLVSNIAFNVGAPMAERFLYQSSVPFLLACVELTRRLMARRQSPVALRYVIGGLLLGLCIVHGKLVIARNVDWRTGDDLFLTDVQVSRNSVRAQTFAGIALIHHHDSTDVPAEKRAYVLRSLEHFEVADSIHPTYLPTLLNMGLAYLRLDSMDHAEQCWDRARAKDPKDPKLLQLEGYLLDRYHREGVAIAMKGDLAGAKIRLERASKYAGKDAGVWYDLGGICYNANDLACARKAWERALQLAPEHVEARKGMAALEHRESAAIKVP